MQKIERIRYTIKTRGVGNQLRISKKELKKLVWKIPTSEIARRFNVSDTAVAKRCKKLAISKPPRGYWAKIRSERKKQLNKFL